jgi:2',3'-cyclic-nucleotide 2'-phosphodiesterase (5'-nucleotidase family)
MRNHPDLDYPLEVKGVDLVLGGHDHVILHEMVDKTPVIKSGSNFRHIGLIKIYEKQSNK